MVLSMRAMWRDHGAVNVNRSERRAIARAHAQGAAVEILPNGSWCDPAYLTRERDAHGQYVKGEYE